MARATGGRGRPSDPAPDRHDAQVDHALSVLDATGTDRGVVVSLSQAGAWALQLAAEHPARVLGAILICPSLALTDGHPVRTADRPASVDPSRVPYVEPDPPEHWVKHDPDYWRDHHEDYLWFFFGMCFPEPHSTKQVEDCVGWGLETTPEVLAVEAQASRPGRELLEEWCGALSCPVLAVHGSRDRISPASRSERIAELTGGEHVVMRGAGHIPLARDPVKVNLLIRDFVRRR